MKNQNNKITVAPLLAMLITQSILRIIGIQNLSANLILTGIIVLDAILIIIAYIHRNEGIGVRFNMTIAISLSVILILAGIALVIHRLYPEQLDKYGIIILYIGITGFCAIGTYIIIEVIHYQNKIRKR